MEEIYFMEWDRSDKEVWKIPCFFLISILIHDGVRSCELLSQSLQI